MPRTGARAVAGGWLAAGLVAGGLLTGGAWFASAQGLTPGLASALPAGWIGRASAQAAPATPQPRAAAGPGQATPGAGNIRKPTGEVTEITAEPASFTVRVADGTLATYRVLDTTVFMAGRDRPYNFGLLEVGDEVVVRGAGQRQDATATPRKAVPAAGKPTPGRTAAAQGDEPIARQVIVRPAGQARRANNGQKTGAQNGGSNAAGQ